MDFNYDVLKRHLIFQNGISAAENAESIQRIQVCFVTKEAVCHKRTC